MAWTDPRDWTTGEVVTAAIMNAHVRDNLNVTSAGVVTTAGDIAYASAAHTMARVAKGTNGNILHQASCAPAWTASPSFTGLTLSGALDVNGTIDYDGTDVDMLSSGDIDLVSSANAANAIYIAQSTGTSGTVKIHADTGTAVNEGVASIQLLSDVGGIGIKSGLNAAGAIRLTADAGTSETILIHADQGNGVGSICLTSDVGGITLNPGTFVTVGGNATNAGEIRIFEDTDNGCNYVAVKAPNVATSYTITLPTAVAGTCGFVLTSTTAGVTSWAAAGGSITSLNNATANELVTIGATTTELCAEASLTFDGTDLAIAAAGKIYLDGGGDTYIYEASADSVAFDIGGVSNVLRMDDGNGRVFINETGNANASRGLTIGQAAADDSILTFKSSDVNTGMTSLLHDRCVEVDDFAFFSKNSGTEGGFRIHAISEGTYPVNFQFWANGSCTGKATNSGAAYQIQIAQHDGANGNQAFTANANLMGIRATDNGTTVTRFLWDLEGSAHADVEWTTYDDLCDIELLRGMHGGLTPEYKATFGQDMMYNLDRYEELGLVGKDSVHWEDRADGRQQLRGMVNFTSLAMLHHSAIIQMYDRLDARLEGIESKLALSEGK